MSRHMILIGTSRIRRRCPEGERLAPIAYSRHPARAVVPRRIPNEFYPTPGSDADVAVGRKL
jgi:hypothetical protein